MANILIMAKVGTVTAIEEYNYTVGIVVEFDMHIETTFEHKANLNDTATLEEYKDKTLNCNFVRYTEVGFDDNNQYFYKTGWTIL